MSFEKLGLKSSTIIGKETMEDLREAIGKRVFVESFDGKKSSFISGKLVGVDDFRGVTIGLENEMFVIMNFLGRGKKIRKISSQDGVIYDNSRNIGKNLIRKGMTEDDLTMLRIRSFGKKVALDEEIEMTRLRVEFLETLSAIIRNN